MFDHFRVGNKYEENYAVYYYSFLFLVPWACLGNGTATNPTTSNNQRGWEYENKNTT